MGSSAAKNVFKPVAIDKSFFEMQVGTAEQQRDCLNADLESPIEYFLRCIDEPWSTMEGNFNVRLQRFNTFMGGRYGASSLPRSDEDILKLKEQYPDLVTLAQHVSASDLNSADFKSRLCDPAPNEHFFIVKGALSKAQQAGALRALVPELLPMTYKERKSKGYRDPMEPRNGIKSRCEGVQGGQFVLYDLPEEATDLGGLGAREQHDRPKSGDTFLEVFSETTDGKRVGAIDIDVADPFDDPKTSFCTTVERIKRELGIDWPLSDDYLSHPDMPAGVSPRKPTAFAKKNHITWGHFEMNGWPAVNIMCAASSAPLGRLAQLARLNAAADNVELSQILDMEDRRVAEQQSGEDASNGAQLASGSRRSLARCGSD
ncbi:hypothetical protein KFL_004940120 [Klebsormidium nitens]|uniref:Uncharacterized protein n=1 Tax=Klebsormidium nitens TaxID=105231 RepID=A0A1Y1IE29_KLENI|nr:hypothetical protein KFL_004940120 [Klebsormidium nitens]|eukprot:GAQ89180.1 hypothetical protein KFL_004940120 [Klebsormidium nitens]